MSRAAPQREALPLSLEVHLLGPFHVAIDGSPVEDRRWSRRKPALLLKLLALQPHQQLHREQAMELLWPALEPESAGNNLHKAIHLARRALEPALSSAAASHFILTQGQQIALRAPGRLWIDVVEFERRAAAAIKRADVELYEEALALYQGDLLIEDLYEDWATARREQLRRTRLDLIAKLAKLQETRGAFEASLERLKELVELDPANEEAHRELMRLYAVTGSRQQSLRQYRRCREALRRELDAEPEPETLRLYEQIAARQIRLAPRAAGRAAQSSADEHSLAILPLANASADPELEYLSDGITESIINNLSQLAGLRVMARSTVFRYKGRQIEPQQVGRELQVRAVLTGRVLQLGDRLVIRTELIDTTDGAQLWGWQADRRLADVLAVQEEIARQISQRLQLKLTGEEQQRLARRHTDDTEAYHAYLKGRYFWNKRSAEGLKKGSAYFRQAIELDPSYAAAYAGLSDSYTLLVLRQAMPPEEGFPKAKAAAAKALEIDETLAEGHASLAHARLHDYDWTDAEREFKRAIELNPGYATAHHWYSEYLMAVGRADEAVAAAKRSQELDPLSLIINANLGESLFYARAYEQAIRQIQKTLEMDPAFWVAQLILGRVYEQTGMFAEALVALQRAVEISGGDPGPLAALAHLYAVMGKRQEALAVLAALRKQAAERYVSAYSIAVIYAGLGEQEQALAWLTKACAEHSSEITTFKVDPVFDSLRSEPGFQDLLRRVGLTR